MVTIKQTMETQHGYIIRAEGTRALWFCDINGMHWAPLPRSRRDGSQLQPFLHLELSWHRGRPQAVEIVGVHLPTGEALIAAWYMNELLERLLPRTIALPDLLFLYRQSLIELCQGDELKPILRGFELSLLLAIEALPDLNTDELGAQISAQTYYDIGNHGWCPRPDSPICGATLIMLREGEMPTEKQLEIVCRRLIMRSLNGRELKTRELWRAFQTVLTEPQNEQEK